MLICAEVEVDMNLSGYERVFCVFVCETDNVYFLLRYDKHYTCMCKYGCVSLCASAV